MSPDELRNSVKSLKTLTSLKEHAKKLGIKGWSTYKKVDIEILRKLVLKNMNISLKQNKKNQPNANIRKMNTKIKAKFVDVSLNVDPNYDNENRRYLTKNDYRRFMNDQNGWKQLMRTKNIRNGDIIFTGSTYESRQEYGFGIVKNNKLMTGMTGEGLYAGVDEGVDSFAENYGFADIDYSNAKSEIKNFGEDYYLFL